MGPAMDTIFRDASRAGVFRHAGEPARVARQAAASGLQVHEVDLAAVQDKDGFLACIGAALRMPSGFASNWDAFADALRDLSWMDAPGWMLILKDAGHFAGFSATEFFVAMDIFSEAAAFWQGEGRPLWILVQGADGAVGAWPLLPAG